MKQKLLILLTLLLFNFNFFYINAQNIIERIENRQNVIYGYNDSVGLSLDYSNTICDTLFYDNKIILLEYSPLLQLDEIRSLVKEGSKQSYDSIYNCSRGYTATWKMENKNLYLLKVNMRQNDDKQVEKIMGLKRFKDINKRPVKADWISGKISGGTDAVRTNYGYAFKQVYEFEFSKGTLINETNNMFPTGSLEDELALQLFLKKSSGALLGVYLHFDRLKKFRENIARDDKNGFFNDLIPLITSTEGESYYAPRQSTKKFTVNSMSLDKSNFARSMISHMNFANMLPKGSFYPRFLRNGVIYQPINIVFSWNLYGDIENTKLQYYNVVPKRTIPDGWKILGEDEPK
ncbi:MAG: hypothetical protein PHY69_07775 [Dysgonamonadaceae bacterium]|nr:hypothetical protein [Dysgonamonadaceae bacterium]